MNRLVFDEEMGKQLEVVYRSRDVLRRRRLVREAVLARPGERILDVGCGPGFYVTEFLEQVGPEGLVVGLDASPQMLAAAQDRCREFDNTRFEQADATSLPVTDESFDAALCVQVLEYVPDVGSVLRELHRALRPGGRLTVWDVDWTTVSWHSSDPERMQRVLGAWDEHLAHSSLPRTLAANLRAAGFKSVRAEGHVFATNELIPDAYGGALFPLIEQFVAGGSTIDEDEARAWAAEQRDLDERGEFFFACVQFCFTAVRAL
jgi:arsenite methyltransferase